VRDVIVNEITNQGIFGGLYCTVSGVTSTRNGSTGIQLEGGSIVNSTAAENEGTGIFFGSSGTVTSSVAWDNGGSARLDGARRRRRSRVGE
jgi:hypothetical protein